MKPWIAVLLAVSIVTASARFSAAQSTPVLPISNSDCVAVDDLGRALPEHNSVGDPKAGRWVGLFYWQWHGDERWWKHYDMTQFLATRPYFRAFDPLPQGGPQHPTWYWAEPLFGYYRSTDEWVIRKHLVMLADAGVDFLFLDYTNGSCYDDELVSLLRVMRDLKSAGVPVPRLTFFLHTESDWKIHHLYTAWFSKPEWRDLWFDYRGKPLLMSAPIGDVKTLRAGQDASLVPTINDFFTFRPTWALFDGKTNPTKWRFMGVDETAAVDADGKPEQVVICKSLGGPVNDSFKNGAASGSPGKTFTQKDYSPEWTLPDSGKGPFFDASWANAERQEAPIALVTGWNEWKASVWNDDGVAMLGVLNNKPWGYLVDEFNGEFNRDLEPMRGGYFDNYYCQLVAHLRAYKGMSRPQPTSPVKTITLDGNATQWDDVTPKYIDPPNDTAKRDADAAVPDAAAFERVTTDAERLMLPMLHYTDDSARNDIHVAQVSHDVDHVYFRATTASPLSPPTDAQWMWLLIDTDANPKTGWLGYDLLINRSRKDGRASVERVSGQSFNWVTLAPAEVHINKSEVVLALPRSLFAPGPLRFNFKWTDNLPATPTLADFYLDGDVAPNTRFSFRYRAID